MLGPSLLESVLRVMPSIAFWVLLPSLLYAHAEDERSHQVITLMPDESGANIQVKIFCGPKLGQTFMTSITMLKKDPGISKERFDPNRQALMGQRAWVDVRCGKLTLPSKDNEAHSGRPPNQNVLSPELHLQRFKDITDHPLLRHHLFKKGDPNETLGSTWLDLELIKPGRVIGTWKPSKKAGEQVTPTDELLLLTYTYRLTWPKQHLPTDGITLTIDTLLNVFTSNSVYEWRVSNGFMLIPDELLIEQEKIAPRDYLLTPPSNRFKLRRAAFYFQTRKEPK
jgi:hypothetical protein